MSQSLFEQAQRVIPGGVNSPVRAYANVDAPPPFIARAEGVHLYDEQGRRYIDYVGSWGPMIAGHAHPRVLQAVHEAVDRGLSFGAPTVAETRLAETIVERVESIEQVRMVNSGTEATMSALRLARAHTGRDLIVKFSGGYHGHSDSLLVSAGSGALTFGEPSSPGVTASTAASTLTAPYNDIAAVKALMAEHGHNVAAIIVEPVAGNMNCVPPVDGFLSGLRALCDEYASVLIFDEVMTGFRVAHGCAQTLYGIRPDLTTLGKIIGGGMPVGAFGGRRNIMQQLAPTGPVYQAGTLSGNPVAMAAGQATLELVDEPGFYEQLAARTEHLAQGLERAAETAGVALSINRVCGMLGLFFTNQPVTGLAQATRSDSAQFAHFFKRMLDHGVYLAPSAFEAAFVSGAHDDAVLDETIAIAHTVFAEL